MSDYSGPIKTDIVKIRILKTGKQCWYYDKVGQVVKAIREITVDDEGTEWAAYKQYPRPKGFESSGHYIAYEIEEVEELEKPTKEVWFRKDLPSVLENTEEK